MTCPVCQQPKHQCDCVREVSPIADDLRATAQELERRATRLRVQAEIIERVIRQEA